MDDEYDPEELNAIKIGDIVRECQSIIPPDRKPWTGLVVYIDKDYYEFDSKLGKTEALIAIHWFQGGYIESLPASVIRIVQKREEKS